VVWRLGLGSTVTRCSGQPQPPLSRAIMPKDNGPIRVTIEGIPGDLPEHSLGARLVETVDLMLKEVGFERTAVDRKPHAHSRLYRRY